jgi:predicted small lipoprotein YifL
MPKFTPSPFLVGIFLAAALSGCGLIGGPFTLPEDDTRIAEEETISVEGGEELATAVHTPLPLQPVTPLPTLIPQLPPNCVDALAVTLDDYGKTLCVGGTVTRIDLSHGTYFVYFGPRGKLYMMGTDWVDRIGLRAGECAYAEGKLSRDGVSPVMPITPFTLKRCPAAQPVSAPERPENLPANCAYALEVTRDDVGRKKCVGGTVAFSEWAGTTYRIYFYTDKTLGLHLVSTKWTGRGVSSGDCIYVTEQTIALEESTNTPILNVVPGNVTFCPT